MKKRFADFLHDHFKNRRTFAMGIGWVFKFGPITVRAN